MCLEPKIIMRTIMQNSVNINSKYDQAIEEIRNYLDENLKAQEDAWIESLPVHVQQEMRDDMAGDYKRDLEMLIALITPSHYANCIEVYDVNKHGVSLNQFVIQQVTEVVPALLCNTLPAIIGEEAVQDMINFYVGNRFPNLMKSRPDFQIETLTWADPEIENFTSKIGEIGVRKLEKLEISPSAALEVYEAITDDYSCTATVEDVIAGLSYQRTTGSTPDINWLKDRNS